MHTWTAIVPLLGGGEFWRGRFFRRNRLKRMKRVLGNPGQKLQIKFLRPIPFSLTTAHENSGPSLRGNKLKNGKIFLLIPCAPVLKKEFKPTDTPRCTMYENYIHHSLYFFMTSEQAARGATKGCLILKYFHSHSPDISSGKHEANCLRP